MIPDSKNRLKKACDDLDMLLVSIEYVFLVIYSSSMKISFGSIEVVQLGVFFVFFLFKKHKIISYTIIKVTQGSGVLYSQPAKPFQIASH